MPQPMRIFAERPNVKKDQENNANHIADFSVINKWELKCELPYPKPTQVRR